ncbi:MAG: OsmC family protein [Vulcanibacillus sp.]
MKLNVTWKGDMTFEGVNTSGIKSILDVPIESGGNDKGLTPMETVLVAIGGCTGMDVISILKKMKSNVEGFNIEIDAERAEEHPKRFTSININYQLEGIDLDKAKIEKAIKLTQEKYCSVVKSLNSNFSYNYEINGNKY